MSIVDAQTRSEIIDVYTAYGEGIDSKNWPMVRDCFADEIVVDYGDTGAATGSAGEQRKAEEWMAALQSVINGFDITRHTISNFRFRETGEGIECRAYLTSDHIIFRNPQENYASEEEVATVVGEYTNVYRKTDAGWKIFKSKLDTHYSKGNIALFAEAGQRAAAEG